MELERRAMEEGAKNDIGIEMHRDIKNGMRENKDKNVLKMRSKCRRRMKRK